MPSLYLKIFGTEPSEYSFQVFIWSRKPVAA